MPNKQILKTPNGETVEILSGFGSFAEVQKWQNERSMTVSRNNDDFEDYFGDRSVKSMLDWYGKNVDFDEMKRGVKQFSDPARLDKIEKAVTNKVDPKVFGMLKKRKLRFSESFGNFSFDRAAQGLFILDEFYSPQHKRVIEDWNEVEEYEPEKYRLIADKSKVERRKELREDGTKKYRTSMKKVFGYFPDTNKQERAVEIYVRIGGSSSLSADSMMYCGTAAVIIAKALVLGGIKVSIKASPITQTSSRLYNGVLFTVKNFAEPLDVNAVAVALSDTRFIRYDGYKTIAHCADEFGRRVPDGLGKPIPSEKFEELLVTSGFMKMRDKPDIPAVFMGAIYSEFDAIRQVENTITLLAKYFTTP